MPKKSKKYVVRLTDAEREILRQVVGSELSADLKKPEDGCGDALD